MARCNEKSTLAVIVVGFFCLWILVGVKKLLSEKTPSVDTRTAWNMLTGGPLSIVRTVKYASLPETSAAQSQFSPYSKFCSSDGEAVFNQHNTGTTFTNCSGRLVMVQSAFCDPSGECKVTGTTTKRSGSMSAVLELAKVQDCRGHVLRTTKKKVQYQWKSHGKKYSAFWLSFRVLPEDIHHLEAPLFTRSRIHLNLRCLSRPTQGIASNSSTPEQSLHPIWLRRRAFVDKTVLMVTQWYSTVELSWIRAYFEYYLSIGADFVAIYTAFDSVTEANYTRSLQSIIDTFDGRVLWFDWFKQDQLVKTWAHSQMAMVFHGGNVFWGSTITVMDLDEIIYFVGGHNLKSISRKWSSQYGNWLVHFKPYFLPASAAGAMLKNACTLNFERIYNASHPHGTANKTKDPNMVQSKYIYHSIEPVRLRTHVVDAQTNLTHAGLWVDDSIAVMLHIRRIVGKNFHGLQGAEKASCNDYKLRLR